MQIPSTSMYSTARPVAEALRNLGLPGSRAISEIDRRAGHSSRSLSRCRACFVITRKARAEFFVSDGEFSMTHSRAF